MRVDVLGQGAVGQVLRALTQSGVAVHVTFLPRDAMLCCHAVCPVSDYVYVFVSVTFVHSVKTNEHIFTIFSLVFCRNKTFSTF